MIESVTVRNIKQFGDAKFDLADHLVVSGPNNCGKTTLLQAISLWSETASLWRANNPDLARTEDGGYPGIELNLLRFQSVPLADFAHLWTDQTVDHSAGVWLRTDEWHIGFEYSYQGREILGVQPAADVLEDDLAKYRDHPLMPVYIPPLSGLDVSERLLDPRVIPTLLARAQAGTVLRNILVSVSRDAEKWKLLQEVVAMFFGYELMYPSAGAEIVAQYRHSPDGPSFDLSSAASGFLQVLLVFATLLHAEGSVLLIDEPDAHLHILLQRKMYGSLIEFSRRTGSQLIIATHSEELINSVRMEGGNQSLRLLAGSLKEVRDHKHLVGTMRLENTDLTLALSEPGVLYVEGETDILILREWARTLGHSLLPFLERPFFRSTAEEGKLFSTRDFSALRMIRGELRGIDLADGDKRKDAGRRRFPRGMKKVYWDRYEIENYLIHPAPILRYCGREGTDDAAEYVTHYMRERLPPVVWDTPFENDTILAQTKGKDILGRIVAKGGVEIRESDYYLMAREMHPSEIHPEVRDKLDVIADHFQIR